MTQLASKEHFILLTPMLGQKQIFWIYRVSFMFLVRNHSISPHLRKIVYFAAIKYGGEEEWEFLWRKYEGCKNAAEREKIISALGAARKKDALIRWEFLWTSKQLHIELHIVSVNPRVWISWKDYSVQSLIVSYERFDVKIISRVLIETSTAILKDVHKQQRTTIKLENKLKPAQK